MAQAIDPTALELDEAAARYPHALVDFLLFTEADATLCSGATVPARVTFGEDEFHVAVLPEHVTAFTPALLAVGASVAVGSLAA